MTMVSNASSSVRCLDLAAQETCFSAFSTSGRSANVLAALRAARGNGLKTVGFSGASWRRDARVLRSAARCALGRHADHPTNSYRRGPRDLWFDRGFVANLIGYSNRYVEGARFEPNGITGIR